MQISSIIFCKFLVKQGTDQYHRSQSAAPELAKSADNHPLQVVEALGYRFSRINKLVSSAKGAVHPKFVDPVQQHLDIEALLRKQIYDCVAVALDHFVKFSRLICCHAARAPKKAQGVEGAPTANRYD